jgi:membrane-associated phospholipid phosphatase
MLFSKTKQNNRYVYYGINLLILIWEMMPWLSPITSMKLGMIYDWSPLLFVPIFYKEIGVLTTSVSQVTYDDVLTRLEHQYFPYVMAMHHQNRANSTLLSEYLHFCYLSFYGLLYGVPLYFYLQHETLWFEKSIFMMLLLFFLCYITHSWIPVCGPRNLFDKINDHRSDGVCFKLVHTILAKGSTHGTAFPSGHTGIATVVLLITWYAETPLFYYLLPLGLGLIVSTIYGRFHYMLDLIAGLFYAGVAFLFTVWVYH